MSPRARLLARLPALAARARAGRVSTEQLAHIADLVRHIGVEQVRDYDQILADLCASAGPAEVARACARIWALVDPDGAEPDPMDDFERREITSRCWAPCSTSAAGWTRRARPRCRRPSTP
jgi:hypothetical protein